MVQTRSRSAIAFFRGLCFAVACWSAPNGGWAQRASGKTALTPPPHPVILVSLDGFRRSYLDSFAAPTILRLGREGVTGPGMRPAFPSWTFPTHYTLVTGLSPEDHHIVSNNVYDSTAQQTLTMKTAATATWWRWRGEPIWVTAAKQGRKTGTMFWPASEAVIGGYRPTYWHPYDATFSYKRRVAQILSWLDLPSTERPVFMTLYVDAVDHAGHRDGPRSAAVRAAVARVDVMLDMLMRGLERRGLTDSVNLIITADHGMSDIAPGRVVFLSDVVDPKTVVTAEGGPYMWVYAKNGNQQALLSAIKRLPHVRAYLREETPKYLHVRRYPGRFAILVLADDGWLVRRKAASDTLLSPARGMHGYDNAYESMKVLFVAHGPGFRAGTRLPVFESLDVYPLLAHLLGLQPAPTSGRLEVFRNVLSDK